MFDLMTLKEHSYGSVDQLTAVELQSTTESPTDHCTCKIIELLVFTFANVDEAQDPK